MTREMFARVGISDDGRISVELEDQSGAWCFDAEMTLADAVTLRDRLSAAIERVEDKLRAAPSQPTVGERCGTCESCQFLNGECVTDPCACACHKPAPGARTGG